MQWIEQLAELARADVAVCGGGPAGAIAALCAARQGARVVLLEQTGCLGGMATSGLVPAIIHLSDRQHWVAAGTPLDIVGKMCGEMGCGAPDPIWQVINPECLKRLLDEELKAAGVTVLFDVKVAAAQVEDGRISAVAVAGCNGLKRVAATAFVDATGDALLAKLAGAPWECGDEDGQTMSPSLCVQYSNIDIRKVREAERRHEDAPTLWMRHKDEIPLEEYHLVGVSLYGQGTGSGNLGHTYGVNAVDEFDRTRGYMLGRQVARTIWDFYRRFVPGYERADLTATAALLGVRESRRIRGDYVLTLDDYQARRHFEDDIACFYYPIDIHASSLDPEAQKQVCARMQGTAYAVGENYGIPYRALIPRGLRNLLVAGRCVSTDRNMEASLRVMSGAMLTGRAAGLAAAMAARPACGGEVRAVPVPDLQQAIRADGGYLPSPQPC